MHEAAVVSDPFEIQATAEEDFGRTRVLKQGETFAIFDRHGDVVAGAHEHHGVFTQGTRFLSRFELRLGNVRPLLLSSTIKKDNLLLAVDLTNPGDHRAGGRLLGQGSLHLFRSTFLWRGICYQRIKITNYHDDTVPVRLALCFDADFADIFEVRGVKRARRGRYLDPEPGDDAVTLTYEGLDRVRRRTRLEFSPAPQRLTATEAHYDLDIAPRAEVSLYVAVVCEIGERAARPRAYENAFAEMAEALRGERAFACTVSSSNVQFNNWVERSIADLRMMVSPTPHGPYPYAGVPWFSTAFGRDGIWTALEYLWVDPALARGVLRYLAATQAGAADPGKDAEPGKILHEARGGEMAALGEVPFGCYYGSVDSTPLFVVLAGAYYERTGDLDMARALWPHVERALAWIDEHGDADRDGFVEYARRAPNGLVNQGWKDSVDAVFHEDGSPAHAPIALIEVQAYVYAAKRAAAALATALGHDGDARRLDAQAHTLKQRFDEAFWDERLGTYALGLDGDKRPLRVRTSNAGHALYAGIARDDRAPRLAASLLAPEMFCGWGIRTVAAGSARYNPMSYHNGSVWPHDNAIIAHGLADYGFKAQASALMEGLFQTSCYVDFSRLPELICGFVRRPDEAPTLYPVACTPQAWAAGAVFMLLKACLGLSVRAVPRPSVAFVHPVLPPFLRELRLEKLRVGAATLSAYITRSREDVGIHIYDREGDVDILIRK